MCRQQLNVVQRTVSSLAVEWKYSEQQVECVTVLDKVNLGEATQFTQESSGKHVCKCKNISSTHIFFQLKMNLPVDL